MSKYPTSYQLLPKPENPPADVRFDFSRSQVAQLLKATQGTGMLAGAWPLLRDAGYDLGLDTAGNERQA